MRVDILIIHYFRSHEPQREGSKRKEENCNEQTMNAEEFIRMQWGKELSRTLVRKTLENFQEMQQ